MRPHKSKESVAARGQGEAPERGGWESQAILMRIGGVGPQALERSCKIIKPSPPSPSQAKAYYEKGGGGGDGHREAGAKYPRPPQHATQIERKSTPVIITLSEGELSFLTEEEGRGRGRRRGRD